MTNFLSHRNQTNRQVEEARNKVAEAEAIAIGVSLVNDGVEDDIAVRSSTANASACLLLLIAR